jgi:hypothetical protein
MENIHLGGVLAMPVDPAVALLQPVGVPRISQCGSRWLGLQVDPSLAASVASRIRTGSTCGDSGTLT